ncbi:hypothetical protein [Candidatus Viridilinea mediisalina]|uniref:Uncharacterized protein n=1 Tax=Candidatus Viridilinea mediisalina TaxID=2024553 RepID=A0A2A6RL97_9CHLR|nr:hypothetical protein [Candidatus Viridilinea mediisalina]PDW03685.1 hypothetical protein CJ255_07635 [Candidatus Viridilinea mediisalina]
MYNGNNGGSGYTRIGSFYVKSIYLYIAAIIAVVVAIFFVMRFLNTSLVMHFGAYAGALLLIGNLRELIGQSYGERGSIALLNVMVGGGLIFAWLAQFFGALFWLPALILVAIATPLIFGRGSVYRGYITAARGAVDSVRRTVGR